MTMIDFQDAKNQKFTEAYKITGPTLVILDIHDGKVKAWKPAPKVWSLVGKKSEFFQLRATGSPGLPRGSSGRQLGDRSETMGTAHRKVQP